MRAAPLSRPRDWLRGTRARERGPPSRRRHFKWPSDLLALSAMSRLRTLSRCSGRLAARIAAGAAASALVNARRSTLAESPSVSVPGVDERLPPPAKLDDPEYNAAVLERWREHVRQAREAWQRKDMPAAEAQLKQALEAAGHFGGSSAPMATSLLNMAQFYRRANRQADAEPLLLRAADVLDQTAGPYNKVARCREPSVCLGVPSPRRCHATCLQVCVALSTPRDVSLPARRLPSRRPRILSCPGDGHCPGRPRQDAARAWQGGSLLPAPRDATARSTAAAHSQPLPVSPTAGAASAAPLAAAPLTTALPTAPSSRRPRRAASRPCSLPPFTA